MFFETEKPCRWCKMLFIAVNPGQVFCSEECRLAAKRERQRKYREQNKGTFSREKTPLEILAREAVEHGMSYGAYTAMMRNGGKR